MYYLHKSLISNRNNTQKNIFWIINFLLGRGECGGGKEKGEERSHVSGRSFFFFFFFGVSKQII